MTAASLKTNKELVALMSGIRMSHASWCELQAKFDVLSNGELKDLLNTGCSEVVFLAKRTLYNRGAIRL